MTANLILFNAFLDKIVCGMALVYMSLCVWKKFQSYANTWNVEIVVKDKNQTKGGRGTDAGRGDGGKGVCQKMSKTIAVIRIFCIQTEMRSRSTSLLMRLFYMFLMFVEILLKDFCVIK